MAARGVSFRFGLEDDVLSDSAKNSSDDLPAKPALLKSNKVRMFQHALHVAWP